MIDASYGITSIVDEGVGDILSANGMVKSRVVMIDSRQGDIAVAGSPLDIELFQITGFVSPPAFADPGTVLNPELTLQAAGDINARLKGVDRDEDDSVDYRAYVKEISAPGTIDIDILDSEQVSVGSQQANVTLSSNAVDNSVDFDATGVAGDGYHLVGDDVFEPSGAAHVSFDPSVEVEDVDPTGDVSASTARSISLSGTEKSFAGSAADADTDRITLTGHGFADGERVIFEQGNGGGIGIASGTYYVKRIDADTLQLASDAALTTIGDITDDGGSGHTLTSGERLRLADSGGLSVGDAVVYGEGTGGIDGLSDGTIYYIRAISGDDVKLSATVGGTSIGGLSDGATYYIADNTGGNIRLAVSYADAVASTPTVVKLDPSVATGTGHRFSAQLAPSQRVELFDAADVSANTITLSGHRFSNGEAVVYLNGGGSDSISGLSVGQIYYVTNVQSDSFQLSATHEHAV